MMSQFDLVFDRLNDLLVRVEALLPNQQDMTNFDAATAFRWRRRGDCAARKGTWAWYVVVRGVTTCACDA